MDKKSILTIAFLLFFASFLISSPPSDGIELFAKLDGFSFDGNVEKYTPDTLFEYINGGADLFLNFEFVKLYTLKYKNQNGAEITVDIYVHADLPNGFGIYTQERPDEGDFIKTGTEGYYEEGVLNFFQGPVYVKISSFDLGKDDQQILKKLAKGISDNIPHSKGYPEIFKKFPEESRIKGSEKYINLNYLGHSFLNGVYSVEYSIKGRTGRMFAIKSGSPSQSEKILSRYLDFIKKKGGNVEKDGKSVRFTDPYYKKDGKMNILISGNVLTGMFCDEPGIFLKMAGYIIDKNY